MAVRTGLFRRRFGLYGVLLGTLASLVVGILYGLPLMTMAIGLIGVAVTVALVARRWQVMR